jgi:carbonic anhydrase
MPLSRRAFVRAAGVTGLGLTGALVPPTSTLRGASAVPAATLPAAAADPLALLLAGNRRWVAGGPRHPHSSVARRRRVASGQNPFAVVFTCMDSRVPPELVFDRGLGDLFVVRTGAHVVDDAVLGSVEFGPAELGTPLVFVLGHERCGAVIAAIDAFAHHGGHAPGHLQAVVDALGPAYQAAAGRPGDPVENTVRAQTRLTVARLRSDPLLRDIRVVGGRYDLDTGQVELVA